MSTTNKEIVLDYLSLVMEGKIDEAYEKHIAEGVIHHNAYTAPGRAALLEGMKSAQIAFPNKEFTIQHVLSDGDFVAVHSHMCLQKDTADFITVHLFRLNDGKIAEMWDCSQQITADQINKEIF